jgi:hypothetical protein
MKTHARPTGIPSGQQPAGLLGGIARAWTDFWFAPADPTTLGLIRICCGLVVLYTHLAYTFDLQALFGEYAWVDLATVRGWRDRNEHQIMNPEWGPVGFIPYEYQAPTWSVWFHVTDPGWMMAVHVGFLAAMALFTAGFCTRVTAVVTWVGALSYIHRAPNALFGQDAIQTALLLYLMIGPSGAALSVDRYLSVARSRRRRRGPSGGFLAEFLAPPPSASANFVLRLMQIHFCFIYLASGLSKLLGRSWWTGTAVWMTMANYEFAPNVGAYWSMLRYLSEHRWLWEVVMSAGTAFTLFMEISFPYLVWNRRLRWVMVTGAVLLHVGIALTMGLVCFGLFMITMVLSFVPGEAVRRWVEAVVEAVRPRVDAAAPPRLAASAK